ncbi:hypothetical protein VEE44_16990 [Escherichia coli]|nr:hypothetical protein VEE44_16990 [Escherichia coli]
MPPPKLASWYFFASEKLNALLSDTLNGKPPYRYAEENEANTRIRADVPASVPLLSDSIFIFLNLFSIMLYIAYPATIETITIDTFSVRSKGLNTQYL